MLTIEVAPPRKTDTLYEFRCVLDARPRTVREVLRGARSLLAGRSFRRSTLRFGFEAVNYAIRHDACWDSVYPLMYLTRNGGPLFHTDRDEATIVFRYPILAPVRDFYVRRAANMGLRIEVEARVYDARANLATDGHVLAFGGGKDSRLILGALRELGRAPTIVTAGPGNVPDLPGALVTKSLSGVLADRVMPALMRLGRRFYFGSGLGEAHRRSPWQQYFDWGSPRALRELSELLGGLGIDMHADAPASVLPYNLIQRILFERYPDLYRHQSSVGKDDRSEKNLHVALCKLHHGIPFDDHCSGTLFAELVGEFVEHQTGSPRDFGFRDHREIINREMRAILFAKRSDPRLAAVRNKIPEEWEGPWIDYIHTYVAPQLDEGFLRIYRAYADPVEETPSPDAVWRIQV